MEGKIDAPERIYLTVDEANKSVFAGSDFRMFETDIEYLKATSAAHWVSVKDRLPEKGRQVAFEGDDVIVDYWDGEEWCDPNITHWLSGVPPIPKGE